MNDNGDDRTVTGDSTIAHDDTSSDTSRLPIGSRLGEFEIRGLVGEGGFSIVYRAWDHSLEREIALKEYLPSSLATRQGLSRVHARSARHQETFEAGLRSFVNEAKLLAQFDHPALVKVHRFWEANGTAYMVMPLYQGITVKDKVRSLAEAPSEAWLRELLEPLTQALTVLHQAQCFHRDIAPDNVLLLTKENKPLLLDFGAARRVIGDKTQALTVILKPGYAPIEQYAEDSGLKQGPWTDVYALAAVVHWIVTGRTPPVSVGRMINDSYVPLATAAAGRYSERFLAGVDRALAVLPDRRTRSIDEFRDDLGLGSERAPRGESDSQQTVIHVPSAATKGHFAPTQAPPDSASAARFTGRKVVAGAVATFSIVALAYWFLRGPDSSPKPTLESSPTATTAPAATLPSAIPAEKPDASPAASAPTLAGAPSSPPPTARAILETTFERRDASIETSAAATLPDPRRPGSPVRLSYVSSASGYPYLFVASDPSGRLTLLHPAPAAGSGKSSAKGFFDVASSDWPREGARTLIVVAREPRDLPASGWRVRDGKFVFDIDASDSAEHAASAAWSSPACRFKPASCDTSYGAAYVSTVEAATVAAQPIAMPTPAPKRSVAQGTTQQGPQPATTSSECGRILQRISLGDSSAALVERMQQLRCK